MRCPICGSYETGRFCANCGRPMPVIQPGRSVIKTIVKTTAFKIFAGLGSVVLMIFLILFVIDYMQRAIYRQLPDTFYFASGVGMWSTEIYMKPDGSFSGEYYDQNGDDCYICDFDGKFSVPQKMNTYTYALTYDKFTVDQLPGSSYMKDNVHFICEEPYGLEDAKHFRLYCPGTPAESLPDTTYGIFSLTEEDYGKVLADGTYVLYSVEDDTAFIGTVYQKFDQLVEWP